MTNTRKNMLSEQIIDRANNDEEFLRALISAQNADEAGTVLEENGIVITAEEVEELFSAGVEEIRKFEAGELSEEALSEVAGGGLGRYIVRGVVSAAVGFGFGLVCGVCPAAAVATPYVVGGLALWCAAGYVKKGW